MPIQTLTPEFLGNPEGFALLAAEKLRPLWFFGYESQVWMQSEGPKWVSRGTCPDGIAQSVVQVGQDILEWVEGRVRDAEAAAAAAEEAGEELPEGAGPGKDWVKRMRAWGHRGFDIGFQSQVERRVRQLLVRTMDQCNLHTQGGLLNARNGVIQLPMPEGMTSEALQTSRARFHYHPHLVMGPHTFGAGSAAERLAGADREAMSTRELYLTQSLGVSVWAEGLSETIEPDWSLKCPVFWRFLHQIAMDDPEWICSVRHALAYSLMPFTNERTLFICYGLGANGKSVLLNMVRRLAGDYGATIDSQALLAKAGNEMMYSLSRMSGVRLAVASETDLTDHLPEARIKALTGDTDAIAARAPYGKPFQFEPQFKLWIMTNHKPGLANASPSIASRIKLIPFRASFARDEQDPWLIDKMQPELPFIASWILRGWVDLVQNHRGLIYWAPAILQSTRVYFEEIDLMNSWFEEYAAWDPAVRASAKDLYDSWRVFCHENGQIPGSMRTFSMRFSDYGRDRIEKVKSNGLIYYWGVRVQPRADFSSPSEDF